MAIDFGGVTTGDNYSTAFVPKINEAIKGAACWLDPAFIAYTGVPFTGAKRLSGGVIQEFDGAAWVDKALAYAPKASPGFTGVPTAPTAGPNTNTVQLATTAFVVGQAATAAPLADGVAAVGTSLRFARQDHVHPTDTTRAPLANPVFTGAPKGPTPGPGDNSTNLATTAFVVTKAGDYMPLAGGALTGTIAGSGGEPLRVANDAGFVSGWNTGATVRCGYLQFHSTNGYIALVAEGTNYLRFFASGVEKMRLTSALADIKSAAKTTPAAIAYAAALAIDASASNLIKVGNLTGNVTSMVLSNATEGQFLSIRFRQDATGGRTIALPAGAAVTGAPNSAANKTSYLNLTWNATDNRWEGSWTAIP